MESNEEYLEDEEIEQNEEKEVIPTFVKKPRMLTVNAAELVTCDKELGSVFCDTFIFDPDESEAKLGSLYLVLETTNNSEKSSEAIEAVSTAIRKEYYRDPERELYDSMEEALKQANHVLSEYVDHGEVDLVDNFHAAACAFYGQNLHISRVGEAELLMARKGHLTDIGDGLSDSNLRRPHHAFTNVASGAVSENDIILLATPQLTRLIPHDRLNHMLTGKTPGEVIGLLRSLLDDFREDTAFALLLLQFAKLPERLPPPAVPLNLPKKVNLVQDQPTHLSVRPRRPINTKRSFWGAVARITKQIAIIVWTFLRSRAFPAVAKASSWSVKKGGNIAHSAKNSAQKIIAARALKKSASAENSDSEDTFIDETSTKETQDTNDYGSYEEDSVVFSEETSQDEQKESISTRFFLPVIQFLREGIKKVAFLAKSGKNVKISLAVIIILGIILTFGIRSLSQKKQQETNLRGIAEKLEQARVKKDNADSALIYNNKDKAKQDLQEALSLANAVKASGHYTEEATSLISSMQEVEDRMDKVTRISSPDVVGDFSSITGALKTPAMVAIDKLIFTFDSTNNAIFQLDTTNKETKVASQSSQGIGYFRTANAIPAEKSILFSTDTPGLAIFDIQRNDLLKQEIKFPDGFSNIKAVGVFGSRLYLLSTEKKMIYGFSKTLAGYDGGSPWLTDTKIPAERAVGMGVDGYIYLLLDDGKIVKMLKGKQVEFKQEMPTKPIVNPTRLVIYDGLKHLYILDPTEKRVVVYDTVGNLVNQYVFPNARNLRDIAIGGKEEILYVLDETRVDAVPLKTIATTKQP
jgi:hypothetical protein